MSNERIQPTDVVVFFLPIRDEDFVNPALHVGGNVECYGDIVQLLVVLEASVLLNVAAGFLQPFEPCLTVSGTICRL